MSSDSHILIAAQPPSIWGNRNVVLLWLSQLISLFGDSIFYLSVIWLALEVTGNNGAAGLVVMSLYLPMIVVGLAGGSLVDRWDRRRTMILSDAARCLLVLLFPLLFFSGHLTALLIAVLAFSVESFSSIFLPARDVLVGELTPKAQLTKANALVQSALPIAMIMGPAAAGLLLPYVGIAHLFTVDAATFVVSLLLLVGITKTPRRLEADRPGKRLYDEVKAGLRYASRDNIFRWLLVITAVDNWFIMGPAIIGMPILVREVIGGPHAVFGIQVGVAQIFALTTAFMAAGFIVGNMFIHHLHLRLNRGRVLLLGIFFDGITHVPLMFLREPELVFLTMFAHGLSIPAILVTRTTMVQEMVPKEYQGRAFALINMTVKGVTALSIGATGFIAATIGANTIFGVWGLTAASLGPIGWAVSSLREAGPGTAATRATD
ncbi:MAG TPA: MFS transporter [Acidobacteriota bacterium]|nr:MFS transporter [Acidobacteriota bacterium]